MIKQLRYFFPALTAWAILAWAVIGVFSPGGVRAQATWTELAQNIVTAPQQHVGALRFRDGVAWAGTNSLSFSTDTGVTWNTVPSYPGAFITDIAIYDKTHILVSTGEDGLYLTTDAGQTWQEFEPGRTTDFTQCSFDGSPSVLLALATGVFFSSTDGGTTWNQSAVTQSRTESSSCFAIDKSNVISVLSSDLAQQDQGWLNNSTDLGQTWSGNTTFADGDCETLSADSCVSGKLYLVNENVAENQTIFPEHSHIDLTVNKGQTWQTTSAYGENFYSGSLASTADVLYVGTYEHPGIGVERSTDDGVTWASIGGPEDEFDTRTIAAVNDNIVLVLDQNGDVWRTLNSGVPSPLSVTPQALFQTDTVSCDSITRAVAIAITGCSHSSISIIGPDSASYTIGNVTPDSVPVTLFSSTQGPKNGSLVISLDDGFSDTVALGGDIAIPDLNIVAANSTLFALDTVGCDSLARAFPITSPCPAITILYATVVGPDSASYRVANVSPNSLSVVLSGINAGDGMQNAELILVQNNGLLDTVLLEGYVNTTPAVLSYSTLDVQTDTLGGTVLVPITINGLLRPETVTLVMHYDGTVDYLGSFTPQGLRLDLPFEQSAGRTELEIENAQPNAIEGYAKFNVFNDLNTLAHATFDSMMVLTQTSTCEYTLPPPVTSIITPLFGCGIQMLSQWIHLGVNISFRIVPNPTNGSAWLNASSDAGSASIAIYDMLGTCRSAFEANVQQNVPIECPLPETSGIYTIVVTTESGTHTLRVVRE